MYLVESNVVIDHGNSKKHVFPFHDTNQHWKLMKPFLGMRFESSSQLK